VLWLLLQQDFIFPPFAFFSTTLLFQRFLFECGPCVREFYVRTLPPSPQRPSGLLFPFPPPSLSIGPSSDGLNPLPTPQRLICRQRTFFRSLPFFGLLFLPELPLFTASPKSALPLISVLVKFHLRRFLLQARSRVSFRRSAPLPVQPNLNPRYNMTRVVSSVRLPQPLVSVGYPSQPLQGPASAFLPFNF